MAARDLWDLLQPTWADRMGATAWDPPNLPLFDGGPRPVLGGAGSAGGAGRPASASSGILGYLPLPPAERPNFASGPLIAQPIDDLGNFAQRVEAGPTAPRQFLAAVQTAKTDALPRPLTSFENRWGEPSELPSGMPSYLRQIPVNPPGVADVPSQFRSRQRSVYAAPSWPFGMSDNPAPNVGTPSANVDSGPGWLRDSMAVPQAATHPASPLMQKGSILDQNGIDVVNLADAIISAESHGDTNAKPDSGNRSFIDKKHGRPYRELSMFGRRDIEYPISSALGAGQFTEPTWVGDLKANQADVIRANPWLDSSVRQNPAMLTAKGAHATGLSNMRTDYDLSRRATARLAEENAASLMRARQPVTAKNIYLAHFLGSTEAINVLNADLNKPAEQVISQRAARANRSLIKGNTVGQLLSAIDAKVAATSPRQLPFR
jgi:hypothetical protein